MAWLTGWGKRKKATLKGSTAGAQTNFPLRIKVHKGSASEISTTGSERATAYTLTNKSVRFGTGANEKTHIAYLNYEDATYKVYVRTYNHSTGNWDDPVYLGNTNDNHGNPCLVVDSSGYLYCIYGGHVGLASDFAWRKSTNSNDSSAWDSEQSIPFTATLSHATHPSAAVDDNDNIHLIFRDSNGGSPALYYQKWNGSSWGSSIKLCTESGYTCYGGGVAIDSNDTLHVAWYFYHIAEDEGRKVAYMKHVDGDADNVWKESDGTQYTLPVSYSSAETLYEDTLGNINGLGNIAIDNTDKPILVLDNIRIDQLKFIRHNGSSWDTTSIDAPTGKDFSHSPTVQHLGSQIFLIVPEKDTGTGWDDNSNKIALYYSTDNGQTFYRQGLIGKNENCEWLNCVERDVGHNDTSEFRLLYTQGKIGGSTVVYFLKIDSDRNVTFYSIPGEDTPTDVYCNNNCRDDFGDIRWTKSDGSTELDYFLEKYVSGDYAIFWVEVDSVPADPDTVDIYVYYDKSDATTTSNGNNTFSFFHNKDEIGDWGISGNELTITVSGDDEHIVQTTTTNNNEATLPISSGGLTKYIIEERKKITNPTGTSQIYSYWQDSSAKKLLAHFCQLGSNEDATYADAGVTLLYNGYSFTLYYIRRTIVDEVLDKASYYFLDDEYTQLASVLDKSHPDAPTGALATAKIQDGTGGSVNYDFYLTWLRIRKYASPEPTWDAWGSEETGAYKTIEGNARIKVSASKTISGNARIKVPISKTIAGNADVKILGITKIVSGSARIKKASSKTLTGNSRIKVPDSKTIAANARIKVPTVKTVAGNAAVKISGTVKTVTGDARIVLTHTKTIQGAARVKVPISKTIQGNADIKVLGLTKMVGGDARIKIVPSKTISGIARIKAPTSKTITGAAYIVIAGVKTISGNATIKTPAITKTLAGNARIEKTSIKTLAGIARIKITPTKTIIGNACITIGATYYKTINGNARIEITGTKTITGNARVKQAASKTIAGTGRIKTPASKTINGAARIKVPTLKTIVGAGYITIAGIKTIQGTARVKIPAIEKTIGGTARTTISAEKTIQGAAWITTPKYKTITGAARVKATITKTILGNARIRPFYPTVQAVEVTVDDGQTSAILDDGKVTIHVKEEG